ncbi:MAG: Stk1 family PASTA domain-containing Ser/Thr kinase [Nocardiaceae bacterium]|nr:Stk1 family PASTA domain-containing Ser/Thr kinase [Nocardiaceae bacterium]
MSTPRILSDRYELGEILGFGGMSEVHHARDITGERDVAIKVLRADLARDPAFYLRFRREAQNAEQLTHQAIVEVYDTGEAITDTGPLPFIVMEYVDGQTLRDMVRTDGPVPVRRAIEIIGDVCAALDFSHRRGIVHRDVKPANIMVSRSGAVKVMDFGIARAISESTSPITQTAGVIGTAQYLSPEQARGERVDRRSDVYSLGCVLYEILTGQPPFKGDSAVAVAYQHVREDPRLPSTVLKTVPRELDSIILKAMAKNPDNRYSTAAEMRNDLIRVLNGQKPLAPTVMTDDDKTVLLGTIDAGGTNYATVDKAEPEDIRPRDEHPRRWPWRWLLLALLAALLVGALAGYLTRSGQIENSSVTVPFVVDQPVKEATAALQDAGFRVTIQEKPDRTVLAGRVISVLPLQGSKADAGSTVTLEVSNGRPLVTVPILNGMTKDEAKKKLEEVELKLDNEVDQVASNRDQIGRVVETKPAGGLRVDVDSTVRLSIGRGPDQVRVPPVLGQDLDTARSNLEAAGFTVIVETVDDWHQKNQVVRTSPGGGAEVDKGSAVTVYVSNGEGIRMPNLRGMNVPQAMVTLRAAGWTGSPDKLVQRQVAPPGPGDIGRVLSQSPSADSNLGKNQTVTISVGTVGAAPA